MFSIKACKRIPWQAKLAPILSEGLKKLGVPHNINGDEGVPILLGPNAHRDFEKPPFLQVNRYFIGTGLGAVHETVAISWNGFNGLGQFNIGTIDEDRLWKFIKPQDILPWKTGALYLLFDQVDNGRSDTSLTDWRRNLQFNYRVRNHISRRPPPMEKDLVNVKAGITFNTTAGVECLMKGVPVVAYDKGNPLYAFVGHDIEDIVYPDRVSIFSVLANCQYTYEEIAEGSWFKRLAEPEEGCLYEYYT